MDFSRMIKGKDVDGLIRALKNDDGSIRQSAAEALGTLEDRRAVDPLIEILQSDHYYGARMQAAESLGMIGDPRAKGVLRAALHDGHDFVVEMAEWALERL